MFTAKLTYWWNGECMRTRLVAAKSITIFWYNQNACQITAHAADPDDDKAFYVGDPMSLDEANRNAVGADKETWYSRAIIENMNGKTTEYINPPPMLVVQGEQRAA